MKENEKKIITVDKEYFVLLPNEIVEKLNLKTNDILTCDYSNLEKIHIEKITQ